MSIQILTDDERKVIGPLQSISGIECGLTVAEISTRLRNRLGRSQQTSSSYVSSTLLRLEKLGVVRRMDDNKPIAWSLAKVEENVP